MPTASPTTSLTLLDCLRESSQASAWERFVRLYTPLFHTWARRQGFHDADIADITQEVLLKLLRKMPKYDREVHPTFRSWLFTVATRQGHDFRRRKATRQLPQADGLSGVQVVPPLDHTEIADAEYKRYIIHRALELIRHEFDERTWAAFTLRKIERVPIAQIAAKLHISRRTVFRCQNEVMTRLRQEIGGLVD